MKYVYPADCKSGEDRRQFRIEARKANKAKARQKVVNAPPSLMPGNGWQRGYGINQYYGNTKTKKS